MKTDIPYYKEEPFKFDVKLTAREIWECFNQNHKTPEIASLYTYNEHFNILPIKPKHHTDTHTPTCKSAN